VKLLIMPFYPPSCCYIPLRYKHSHQRPVLRHRQSQSHMNTIRCYIISGITMNQAIRTSSPCNFNMRPASLLSKQHHYLCKVEEPFWCQLSSWFSKKESLYMLVAKESYS
jgi:hypothetical protein